MQSALTIRNWQLDKLTKTPTIMKTILQATSQEDATTYRDGGDGWTVLEVLCHLRDYDALFVDRAQVTLTQEFGDLPNPDPDKLAADNRYNEQDLQQVFDEWVDNRRKYLALLETVNEEDWERPARHPRRGPFTLNDQVLLAAWHDVNHLEQITRTLNEKRTQA